MPRPARSAPASEANSGRRIASAPGTIDPELQKAIDQHAAAVYRIARSIVRDPALADDVVQETMIKAWRSSPVGPGEPIPRSWLFKLARNTSISMLRSRREDLPGPAGMPDENAGPGPDRAVVGRAELAELGGFLERIGEQERTLIIMREIDGMSYDELAQALDLPLSTVKTRLFRARRALKDAMEAWQ